VKKTRQEEEEEGGKKNKNKTKSWRRSRRTWRRMVVTLDCGGGLLGLRHCQQVVNGFLDGPGFRNGVCEMKRNGFQNDTKLVWSRKMKQQQEPTRGVRQRKRPAGKQRIQAVAAAYPPIAKTEKTFRLPIDYYQV
jgi:hypothetical protein